MSAGTARYIRSLWAALALVASAFVPAQSARAEIISISAVDFALLCPPCGTNAHDYTFNNGLLIPTDRSIFYATVPFPTNNQKVCSFSLVYQDINAGNPLTARLLRKPFAVGSNPTGNPVVMATAVSASGVVNTVRKATTTTITQPTISKQNSFYIAAIDVQTINTNFLGVQIDYRPTCP
jgi:hypothetical protein